MADGLTRNQMAWRLGQDIADGSYVNLGVGIPLLVLEHTPAGREIIFHSENGVLGMKPKDETDGIRPDDLTNAGKQPVSLVPGAAMFHHADSFIMIRGGHLDIAVLGAYQVAENGDLANWRLPGSPTAPAVGGAMDLAAGAKNVWVLCEHNGKDGTPKIVRECTLPLTGPRSVNRIYTDLAIIDVTPDGLVAREKIEALSLEDLQARSGAPLTLANDWRPLEAPDL